MLIVGWFIHGCKLVKAQSPTQQSQGSFLREGERKWVGGRRGSNRVWSPIKFHFFRAGPQLEGKVTANRCRVSLGAGGKENVLALDKGDVCTTLWRYWIIYFDMVSFMLCELYLHLKKGGLVPPWIMHICKTPSIVCGWEAPLSTNPCGERRSLLNGFHCRKPHTESRGLCTTTWLLQSESRVSSLHVASPT